MTLVNLWNVRFANLSVLNILHLEHMEHFKCSSVTCRLVPVQTDRPSADQALSSVGAARLCTADPTLLVCWASTSLPLRVSPGYWCIASKLEPGTRSLASQSTDMNL